LRFIYAKKEANRLTDGAPNATRSSVVDMHSSEESSSPSLCVAPAVAHCRAHGTVAAATAAAAAAQRAGAVAPAGGVNSPAGDTRPHLAPPACRGAGPPVVCAQGLPGRVAATPSAAPRAPV